MAALEKDPNLNQARFALVPKHISEDLFWRNYFYRIHIIKQAYNILEESSPKGTTNAATEGQSSPEGDKPIPPFTLPAAAASGSSPAPSTSAEVQTGTPVPLATAEPMAQPVLAGNTELPAEKDNETIEFASEYYELDEQGAYS